MNSLLIAGRMGIGKCCWWLTQMSQSFKILGAIWIWCILSLFCYNLCFWLFPLQHPVITQENNNHKNRNQGCWSCNHSYTLWSKTLFLVLCRWIRRWWIDRWIWFMSCHARRGMLFNYNAARVDYDYFNFNNEFVHQMIIFDFKFVI